MCGYGGNYEDWNSGPWDFSGAFDGQRFAGPQFSWGAAWYIDIGGFVCCGLSSA
jgi:hypothetical protein